MKSSITIAFKEWAIVCRAIASGRQTLILRKGGISEKRGGFEVEHREFLLFPTLFHQQNDAVIPDARAELDLQAKDTVTFSLCAEVIDVQRLTDWERVRALASFHIWTEETIKDRFGWGNPSARNALGASENAITLIVARFYCLPSPVAHPLRKSYSGCTSWVTLEEKISIAGAKPILTDAEFSEWVKKVRGVLV